MLRWKAGHLENGVTLNSEIKKTYSKLIQPPQSKSRKLKKPTAPRKGLFKKQNVSASSLPTVNESISNDVTTATMSDGTVTLTSY